MKLIGPDFYNISDLLTEEELLIQKTANDLTLLPSISLIYYKNLGL